MGVTILIGDCRERLRELPDGSVHCCVTSPPYFGLRDYGTAAWEGGDGDCDHKQSTARKDGGRAKINGFNGSNAANSDKGAMNYRELCGKCGATRIDRQMGLEPTPDEFVVGMVEVFREVRRVLRDDATLWLNIGDSYSGSGRGGNPEAGTKQGTNKGSQSVGVLYGREHESAEQERERIRAANTALAQAGCKPKDLIGIPWMLAFALRADGWYLRQEIIWHKPNPMPESVRDRCTKAHEQIFLLSKSPRYYFDAEAIAEPLDRPEEANRKTPAQFGGANKHVEAGKQSRLHSGNAYLGTESGTRNKRDVWTVASQPFAEAHFATYPPDLIEPCILAGCPTGGTVLDPFGGAGTTGLVADRLGRNAILVELNPEYAAIAERRLNADAGMFAEVKAA